MTGRGCDLIACTGRDGLRTGVRVARGGAHPFAQTANGVGHPRDTFVLMLERRMSGPPAWAHGETFPTRDPNDMWLFPDSTSAGADDIGWTIVHELYHLNNPAGSEAEAEEAASKCAPATTIQINVRPKQ